MVAMKRKEIILNAVVVISILIAASFARLYFSLNSATHLATPRKITNIATHAQFDYNLDVYPVNGTVRQGNSILTSINITYIQGTTQNVTLTATGPEGITFSFSNQTGTPSSTDTFASNLTINVSDWLPTGVYSINVTSSAFNGKTCSDSYTLTVLEAEIHVSGISVVYSDNCSWPVQVEFIGAGSTYVAHIHLIIPVSYKYLRS